MYLLGSPKASVHPFDPSNSSSTPKPELHITRQQRGEGSIAAPLQHITNCFHVYIYTGKSVKAKLNVRKVLFELAGHFAGQVIVHELSGVELVFFVLEGLLAFLPEGVLAGLMLLESFQIEEETIQTQVEGCPGTLRGGPHTC